MDKLRVIRVKRSYLDGEVVSFLFQGVQFMWFRWLECDLNDRNFNQHNWDLDQKYIQSDAGSYQGVFSFNVMQWFRIYLSDSRIKGSRALNLLSIMMGQISKCNYCLPSGRCRDFTNSLEWLVHFAITKDYITAPVNFFLIGDTDQKYSDKAYSDRGGSCDDTIPQSASLSDELKIQSDIMRGLTTSSPLHLNHEAAGGME